MPFYFRKTKRVTPTTRVNVTKTGASVSKKVGPVTLNSRGRVTVRIAPGLSFRIFGGSRRRKGWF
jgi:hypothetical protein